MQDNHRASTTMASSEWPLNLASEIRSDETASEVVHSLARVNTELWLYADSWWADIERDRQSGQSTRIPTSRELRFATGEFVDRWGYEAAERFIADVISGATDEHAPLPFTALTRNIETRFGRRGRLHFAGFLAAHCAGNQYWRRGSS